MKKKLLVIIILYIIAILITYISHNRDNILYAIGFIFVLFIPACFISGLLLTSWFSGSFRIKFQKAWFWAFGPVIISFISGYAYYLIKISLM